MRTPSLATRIVAAGAAVVVVLAVGLDLLLYFSLRSSLMAGLDTLLDSHAALVETEGRRLSADGLVDHLSALGLAATVRRPDGTTTRATPRVLEVEQEPPHVRRDVALPDGSVVTLTASRAEADRALERLLRLELVVTPLVVALAVLLLRLIAEIALRPLEQIAAAAKRTAEGHRGERLRPQQPGTRLGQVATAYDEMLDALETAVSEARAALAQSDRLLERDRQILATAHEAFVAMDEEGLITDWNAEAERTFGWSRDEALGRPVAETVIPPHLRHQHRAGLEHYLKHGTGALIGRRVELTGLHRDGHEFPIEITVWVTRHEGRFTFNAFLRDISAAKQAQEAVSRLASIVESTDAAMLSTDLEGIVTTWNRGAQRMYGWAPEEAIGQRLDIIVPEGQEPQVQQALGAVRRGEVVRVDTIRQTKNGTLIDVALTVSPVRDEAGNICGASSIARDITEERWVAAQLDATLAQLETALEEAKSSEVATRRFLDDAAHQLRTPMTSIRASAEALARGTLPEERERLITAVVRETSRASRLMAGLLQMARLNQGRRLAPEPCDLLALCRDEADRLRWMAPQLDVVVSEGSTPTGKPEIDQQAVGEILANLLDNARRHARSRIEMQVERTDGQVELRVIDDGPGLPPNMAETAFDRFVSLDAKGGSGLGLPIARELARTHGGEVSYEDKAFVVRLPASSTTSTTTAI